MFCGRLAARHVGVPVILSALHSTGWPDGVGRLNRMITPITDSFIAVAASHGQFLAKNLGIHPSKVAVIPNGVDTQRFLPLADVSSVRQELRIGSDDPVVGIVAALRPEKNHELFLEMASRVVREIPTARFLIIGDGPCREALEAQARSLDIEQNVMFLGSRSDIPRLLAALDVFALTSHIEANPVSILEAMSVAKPVVATNVGSIHEAVAEGQTGFLATPGDAFQLTDRILRLLNDSVVARAMGVAARVSVVKRWSIESMVEGYEHLIESVYARKVSTPATDPTLSPAKA
jgi:glycosyltransferase involved in cell wall biosynthesis